MIEGPPIVDVRHGAVGAVPNSPFYVGDWERLALFFNPSTVAQSVELTWLRTRDDSSGFMPSQQFHVADAAATINPPRLRWFPPVLAPWVQISVAGGPEIVFLHVYPTNRDPGAQTPPTELGSNRSGGLLAGGEGEVVTPGTSHEYRLPPYVGRAHVFALVLDGPGIIDIYADNRTGTTLGRLWRRDTPNHVDVDVNLPARVNRVKIGNSGGVNVAWYWSIVGVPT